jgi:hypothetical protein
MGDYYGEDALDAFIEEDQHILQTQRDVEEQEYLHSHHHHDDDNDNNENDDDDGSVHAPEPLQPLPPQLQVLSEDEDDDTEVSPRACNAPTDSDPRNSNNQARSIKIVPKEDVQLLNDTDGYMYCMVSPADGPMLSNIVMQQIMCMSHVLKHPISEQCVVETKMFKPLFQQSKPPIMEKLVHRSRLTPEQLEQLRQDTIEIETTSIDLLPLHKRLEYHRSSNVRENVERVVNIADMLLVPVTATYLQRQREGSQSRRSTTFWMLVVKTRNCYNLLNHMHEYIIASSSKNISTGGVRAPSGGSHASGSSHTLELLREVLLYQYKMSPSVCAHIAREKMVHVDPFEQFNQHNTPLNLKQSCSIFECLRGIIQHIGPGIITHTNIRRYTRIYIYMSVYIISDDDTRHTR